jgi:phage-related protein
VARTVGSVDIDVDFDGRDLPAQARKYGEQAGAAYDKAFGTQMSKLSKDLEADAVKNGRIYSTSWADAVENVLDRRRGGILNQLAEMFSDKSVFQDFLRQSEDLDAGLLQVRESLKGVADEADLTDKQINSLMMTGQNWTKELRNERDEMDRYAGELGGLTEQLREMDNQRIISAAEASGITKQMEADRDRLIDGMETEYAARDNLLQIGDRQLSSIDRESQAMRDLRNARDDMLDSFTVESTARDNLLQLGDRQVGQLREDRDATYDNANSKSALSSALDKMRDSWRSHSDEVDRNSRSMRGNIPIWSSLDDEVKLLIFAIVAAGQSLAVLGSFLGSSLVVLGGIIAGFVISAGIIVAAFHNLESASAEVRAQIEQGLKPQLDALGEVIGQSFWQDMAEPLRILGETIGALTPSIGILAGALGGVAGDMLRAFGSTDAVERMRTFIEGLVPVMQNLGVFIQGLGGSLLNLFIAALPSMTQFSQFLATIFGQFAAFTGSVQGQERLFEFFETGRRVAEAFVPLLVSVAEMLASLVTPQSINDLLTFMGTLSEMMPVVGAFLATLGELQIFDLLAQFVVALGAVLTPLTPILQTLAGQVYILVSAFLDFAVAALVPLTTALAPIIDALLPVLVQVITQVMGAIGPLIPLVAELVGALGAALMPILAPIIDLFAQLLPPIMLILGPLIQLATAIIPPLASILGTLIQIGLTPIITMFTILGQVLGPIIDLLSAILVPVLTAISFVLGLLLVPLKDGIARFQEWSPIIGVVVDAITGFLEMINLWVIGFTEINSGMQGTGEATSFLGDLWNTVMEAMGAALQWLYDTIVKPVGDFFIAVFDAIGAAVTFWWENVVKPVFDFFTAAFQFMYDYVVKPVSELIMVMFQTIGALIEFWWRTMVMPVFDLFNKAFKFIYDNVVKPVSDFIMSAFKAVGDAIATWWRDNVEKTFNLFIKGIQILYDTYVRPVLDNVKTAFNNVATAVKDWWNSNVSPIFDNFNKGIQAVQDWVSKFGGTVQDIFGKVGGWIKGGFDGVVSFIKGIFNDIIGLVNGVIDGINGATSVIAGVTGNSIGKITRLRALASGGYFDRATPALVGEAGPEVVVPLSRPLNQVDPSVRGLSALLQGISYGGGNDPVAVGHGHTFHEGAIQIVSAARDPYLAAKQWTDEVVAHLG